MAQDFPELTTTGALFRFARCLEEATAEAVEAAAGAAGPGADGLRRIATKHRRRSDDLERMRKERMNETVLEPLTDMARDDYVPTAALAASGLDAARGLEEASARFYRAAIEKAGPVLAEVCRSFARLAKDNDKYRAALGE